MPAKVLGDTAKSLTSGEVITIALSASGTGEGIIGFEGTVGNGTRRTETVELTLEQQEDGALLIAGGRQI